MESITQSKYCLTNAGIHFFRDDSWHILWDWAVIFLHVRKVLLLLLFWNKMREEDTMATFLPAQH